MSLTKDESAARARAQAAATEQLILVDEHDNEIGTASREECHRGSGLRHRAFVVLIENDRAELLLQRRCGSKLGGDRWDVSATSHVRSGETYESAILRCVRHELGIVERVAWHPVLSYIYEERLGDASENEFCLLYSGRYTGALQPNYSELTALRWVRLSDLADEIRADPLLYTSWLKEAVIRFVGLRA
jgi:isopentenyl-diphosphate delta-isomerase